MCALACAIALVAGAGAQGGLNPIAPADSGRQAVPETTTTVPDTGLARPEPSLFDRPDSVPSPDSLLQVAADSARTDSLVYDSARGGWRVVIPVEDSLRAAAIQVDRSSWITWTPRISKLALPMELLRDGLFASDEPWHLRYPVDARSVRVDVDAVKGTITQSLSAADVALDRVREIPLEDYARDLTARNLRREWVEQSARRINNVPAAVANEQQRGPLNFRLPSVLLPSAAQSILGRGGPSLNVSGSERISIAGTSNWDNLTSGTGVKRSLFPSLDMKQDLDIRLDGSLGDKVRVDVAQNSATTVPLANRIGIRYTGYEDEILKNLDLGNTNLSLPGTQYVSYSGRNEGLFGVKAAARVGGTDLAVIASKQEGRSERRSFQGTSQEITRTIDDLNYVKGKYFFLERPIEQLASNSRIDVRTVQVFVDNGNGSDNQGVRAGYAEVDPTQPAGATARLKGDFDGLRPLQDYEVSSFYYGERFPILILKNAIASSQVLAVSYDEILSDGTTRRTIGVVPAPPADPNAPVDSVRLKLLQAPRDQLKGQVDNTDFYETDPAIDPLAVTREYELRNVYDLQTINIDPKSLNLTVRRYDAATVDATDAYKEGTELFTYLRIMGADLFKDNGTGTPLEGPDELTDQFTGAYWLDTERGILFFPDLRPFDPRVGPRPDRREEEEFFFKPRIEADQTIPGLRGRIFWPPGLENPPGVPGGGPTPEELEANRNPYDKRNIQQVQDRRYYISAKFSGQDYSGTINLGQFGILEGSEVVAIEGVPLERNKDYSIDYEAGTVTLLTARAQQNRSRLSIDYSYAPLFDQAGKTLVGGTVGFRDARRSMGGAFIYESKGEQESRPRLGEEPSRTLIGDVYGDFRLKPQFLTDLADRLPFYSTTEPSQLDINGEVGISMPNPNTKNTVYVDDFEGNRDSWSAPMTRAFWKWPAPPEVINVTGADTVDADYAELIWYNPVNTIHARDLNPRLTDAEGADNVVTALDFYIPKAPAVRNHPESMWTGITTTVEPDGADFSRLQYLELWINDWNDPDVRMDPDLKLHIDLGLISEDQQRAPGVGPNNLYDTEDVNRDGKYDQSTDPATREDPGADAVPNELEADLYDLSTATDLDKHGDNWRQSDADLGDNGNVAERLDPVNYIGPTLSEKSKGTYEVGSRLFTEDLNNNQSLDAINQYVTYTLRLGDEASLAPFLIFDAQTTPNLDGSPVAPNNGWRRYRIPLDASDSVKTVIRGGSLSNVKHLRVWLEGITNFKGNDVPRKETEVSPGRQPLIQVAAIDVVGNRWRIAGADSALSLANGSVVARNINNQEDRNIYDPPFGVATTSSGGSTETEREQSIALEVTRLPVGSTASIFKDGTLAEDYTRYGRIGFYQTAFGFTDEDSARFFLRMGYDDRNYYEYSRPIRGAPTAPSRPTPWNEIQLALTDFTDVKLNRPAGVLADTVARGDERFIVVGQPTFTRIQRLSIGAYSEKAYTDSSNAARALINMSGQVWVDELRALDVDRSRGLANRLTVYAKVADLFTLTTNWDRTDENFQRLGQLRGSDIRSNRISFVGQFQPHRFAAHSGVLLPISFGYTKNTSIPRLRTGTDVFLRGEDALDEQSQSVDRNFSVSLQKQGDRNPILRNTIGRMGINFSFSDRVGKSPTARDSSRSLSSGISYSIAPAEWFRVPIPIWKLRAGGVQRLKLLPETATISYTQTTARTFTFKRGLEDPVGLYSLQSDIYRKQSAYQLGATWRPLPFGSYAVSATRNAYIPGVPPAYILGINFGRMTNFNQRIDGRFTLPVHSFFRPSFDFATNYTEARTPDLSPTLQLGTFANATNAGVRWELPFTRLAARRQPQPQQAQPQPPPPSPGPTRTSFVDSTAADTSATGTVTPPPPPPPPPPPSGGGFSLPVGAALSRIGNVNMSITFSRTTAFSRYTGVPSVPYRMGLTRDPDVQWSGDELQSIFPGPQATDNQQRTYTGDASTTVGLIGRATARVRFNYSNLSRNYNSQVSNSQNTTFPDIQFDWGQVTSVLRLGKAFSAINAQSKFSIVKTLEGSDLDTPTSRVRTQNLSPLLQLSGQMRSTANVQISLDRRTATREEFSIRRALRKEGDTTVRGSISRSYLPGQKMPIFGGKGLKSTLTLTLDGSFNKRANSTESTNLPPTRTKTDKLDFNGSGTYSFSNYVNGTVGLGFSQTRDLIYRTQDGAPRTTRSIRLEAAASVRF